MGALMAIFSKAFKISHLLVIEELQVPTAGIDYRAFEFQCVLHTLIVTCIDLGYVRLVTSVNSRGNGIVG